MNCVCKFDEVKDVHKVDQFGFVDLVECLRNGDVPSQLAGTDDNYNGIEDPASIIGKPADVFDAIRMSDYIKKNGKKSDGSAK